MAAKSHYIDSQNSDITAPSGRKVYHLQFSLQAASPETFGYTLVCSCKAATEFYCYLESVCTVQ